MNELVGRIRAEFLEMPGLRLTLTQASRLWGLDEGASRRVIDVLFGSSFLRGRRAARSLASESDALGPWCLVLVFVRPRSVVLGLPYLQRTRMKTGHKSNLGMRTKPQEPRTKTAGSQKVRVRPGEIRVDADEHDRGAARQEPARHQLLADQGARHRHVLTDLGVNRPDPQYSDRRRAVSSRSHAAMIGARGRSADSRRAVPPPRVTATIARASLRLASVTAASQIACVGSLPRPIAATGHWSRIPDSASAMIASSVCTARTGNAPAAVSPASMIASTPSSTALAASLTSARVGRGSVRHGFEHLRGKDHRDAAAPGAQRDVLLRRGHTLERHLQPEIAARHHHAVARRQNLVELRRAPAAVRSSRPAARRRGRRRSSARGPAADRPRSGRS